MKKIIIFLIIIILIMTAVFLGYNYLTKIKNTSNSDNTQIEDNNDNSDNNIVNDEQLNTSIDAYNTILYIGMEDNFEEYKVNIDKSTDVMEQAKQIVEEIGKTIGYNIEVVDIVNGKGGITVNFSLNSAPFNLDAYIGNGKIEINDNKALVYTIFDSIQKTLKEYFGGNPDIWYVVEDQEITIDTINPELYLPYEEPYQGSDSYK